MVDADFGKRQSLKKDPKLVKAEVGNIPQLQV